MCFSWNFLAQTTVCWKFRNCKFSASKFCKLHCTPVTLQSITQKICCFEFHVCSLWKLQSVHGKFSCLYDRVFVPHFLDDVIYFFLSFAFYHSTVVIRHHVCSCSTLCAVYFVFLQILCTWFTALLLMPVLFRNLV